MFKTKNLMTNSDEEIWEVDPLAIQQMLENWISVSEDNKNKNRTNKQNTTQTNGNNHI